MSDASESSASAMQARERWLLIARIACIVIVTIVIVAQWVKIMKAPNNDFDLHYIFATRLINGEFLYAHGMHIPYPPFWAMAHVPFIVLPMDTVQIVYYPLGLLTVIGLFMLVGRLVRRDVTVPQERWFWVVMLAVLLASRFLMRDAMELYVNTTLVLLAWLAVYAWTKGRDWLGGLSLGLAVALKMTAALFIPYFLLKRQWKLAGAAMLFAILFTLAPVLVMGTTRYTEHMKAWTDVVIQGVTQKDPSIGVLGQEQFENMSLRSTLVRDLMDLPVDHAGRAPVFQPDGSRAPGQTHPAYIKVGSLSPAAASWVIRIVTLGLLLLVAWPMRHAPRGRDDPLIIWECAAVSVLLLVLSPITWGQHCVGIVPACLLLSSRFVRGDHMPAWMWIPIGWYVLFAIVLNRGIVGKSNDALLQSYHVVTFALLGLLAVTMGWRSRVASQISNLKSEI